MSPPRPFPGDLAPDRVDEKFWEACREGRYLLFRCRLCDRAVWPAGSCPEHGMAAMVWGEGSGRGRLHTWTVIHQRYATSFADPPANVAVVKLDEGPLVHTTVVDADRLEIGMRLEVAFQEIGRDVVIPVFRPVRGAGGDDPRYPSRVVAEPGWAESIARQATARLEEGAYIGPRAKLVTAGQQLLFERGDTSYTIEELVRRAGVGLKTFYRLYPTKEEFLQTVFTTIVTESTPKIREHILAWSDDPLARLRRAVTWPLEWRKENERTSRVIANEHMRIALTNPETIAATSRPYEALIRELVVDATAAGLVHPADLQWDVHIITSLVTTSFHTLILGLGEPDRAALAENVWRFCLSALRGPAPASAGGPVLDAGHPSPSRGVRRSSKRIGA